MGGWYHPSAGYQKMGEHGDRSRESVADRKGIQYGCDTGIKSRHASSAYRLIHKTTNVDLTHRNA